MSKFSKLAAAAALHIAVGTAAADMVVMQTTTEFSGAFAPTGTPSWITATFTDLLGGGVELKLENTNLTGEEFVTAWYFNVNSAISLAALNFTNLVPSGGNGFAAPTITKGVNAFYMASGGRFDVSFSFSSEGPGSGVNRFGAGESLTLQITAPGLVATDFVFLSAPVGGNPPLYHAAKVQGIGSNGQNSGKVTGGVTVIPAPAAVVLGMMGLGAIPGIRRRFS